VAEKRERSGESRDDPVPVKGWVAHPVSDSADYLDREPPQYVDGDEETLFGPSVEGLPAMIATRDLRGSDIPSIDADAIDYSDPRPQLERLWSFALSFDGYRYFGGDSEHVGDRLGSFANSVERAYARSGELPCLGEIGMYRACLFFEQRNWCKWGKVDTEMTRADVHYFVALIEAIRARLK
jgi:hypothetical protein